MYRPDTKLTSMTLHNIYQYTGYNTTFLAILYSFTGRFQMAKDVLDINWVLFYIKIFSEKEMEIPAQNQYVHLVSEKGITYTDEFKREFIAENKKGKLPRGVFE